MKYDELIILLPCHSLEDFPTYHEGEDAESLLASWSALWHPALLASAGQAPTWRRIDEPPSEVQGRLIVVPTICVQRLPAGFAQRVKDEGGILIRKTANRAEILEAALAPLTSDLRPPTSDLSADFLALGYCYLQIELLTRQMRYSSNLDETYFKSTAVAAAVAAMEGNRELAKEKLAACFSVLAEERDHYYPVDAYILDLTLTAATTIGQPLRQELEPVGWDKAIRPQAHQTSVDPPDAEPTTAKSLLMSASILAEMAAKEPDTLAVLKEGFASGQIGLIGGEHDEGPLPLLSHESVRRELERGLKAYQDLLGRRPHIYGRWRYGLTPHLPGILHKFGFKGALHTGFEEGKTPDGLQFKIRWEGADGSAIDAIAKSPLDASKPQTFLALATKLGESMDSDHVATLCLAHWPGQASPWIDDLRRIAAYCSALGKWVTVDEYFEKTDHPGQLDRFEASRYRSPYLKQAIIRKEDDPISRHVRYWRNQLAARNDAAMYSLAAMVAGRPASEAPQNVEFFRTEDSVLSTQYKTRNDSAPAIFGPQLAADLTASSTGARGTLIINPFSFVRRIGVSGLQLSGPPTAERPVYAAEERDGHIDAVVDVPAFGFVHVAPGGPPSRDKKPMLLAADGVLRNEFFEAIINPTTGSLAAIHEYKSRGNRLSQQLALRTPGGKQKPGDSYRDPDEAAVYSVMAADSIETTIATTTLGEIVTRGRLLDTQGKRLAGFVQTYRLWRGSRVLHLTVELDPAEEPRADPWNSYYCCRFAWSNELAELFRTVNETRHPATEKRFESPLYIDITDEKTNTSILTGGLPFHRRNEERMLDTLLIARGERERKFHLGIGVDLVHPLHEALGIMTPPVVVPDIPQPASGNSGWLLHLSSRNVITTSLQALDENGRVTGFRARLLETAGRPANLVLTAFRSLANAATVDFLGQEVSQLEIEDGKARLNLSGYEWTEIVARWA
jgi:alpha-mannosidase